MANSNKLVFGVGFDVRSGFSSAQTDMLQVINQLNKIAKSKSITLPVGIDTASIKQMQQASNEIQKIFTNIQRLTSGGTKGIGIGIIDVNPQIEQIEKLERQIANLERVRQQLAAAPKTPQTIADLQTIDAELSKLRNDAQALINTVQSAMPINAALTQQIEKLAQLSKQVTELDAQYARLNAQGRAMDAKGNATPEAAAILKQRRDLLQEIAKVTQTAAEAEQKYQQQQKERLKDLQSSIAQIDKENEAYRKRTALLQSLTAKIGEYATQRANAERGQTAVERTTNAYHAQLQEVQKLKNELNAASSAVANFNNKTKYNKDGTQTKAYTDALQKEVEVTRQLEAAERNLTQTHSQLMALYQRLGLSGGSLLPGAGGSVMAVDAQIDKYNQLQERIHALTVEFDQLKAAQQVRGDTSLQERINAVLKERAELTKEVSKITQTADQAQADMLRKQEALQKRILAHQQKNNQAIREGAKVMKLPENSIQNIEAKLNRLRSVIKRVGEGSDEFRKIAEEIGRLERKLADINKKYDEFSGKAQSAGSKHVETAKKVNDEYGTQSAYLNRLIQRMATYASIGAIGGFLTKIREVTAQFELQRVALGAIINDTARGNALFSEIKQYALKSPITIMDLTKYTKQVAAFRFGVDDLFDTTKRLADISIGLGVDMQRLVLALGHVKATTYLNGITLRQFSLAGIPMLELLAEHYQKLENQVVTTGDVMKRVHDKMVAFEDVNQVLHDLTDAGGMFYNMQEKMGNTLYGMWAKLGDAASIMYDQIGNTESVNKGMKDAINMLTAMMRNWQDTARYMSYIGIAILGLAVRKKMLMVESARVNAVELSYQRRLMVSNRLMQSNNWLTRQAGSAHYVYATALQRASLAANAFGTSLRAIRSALITTGWGALIVVLTYLADKLFLAETAAKKASKALKEVVGETGVEQTKSVRSFENLVNTAADVTVGMEKQQEALDELKRTYGKMLPIQDLTIEKLQALNGNYQSLTNSVKDYIAEEMKRKALDRGAEIYGVNITKYQQSLTTALQKAGYGDAEIQRFWDNFNELARESSLETADVIRQAWTKAMGEAHKNAMPEFMDVANTDKWSKWAYKNIGGFSLFGMNFDLQTSDVKLIDLLRDEMLGLTEYTDAAEAQFKNFSTAIKEFAENADASADKIAKFRNTADRDSKGGVSFFGEQQIRNFTILTRVEEMKKDFAEIGAEWNDVWANLIETVDEKKPELLSSIDFTTLIENLNAQIAAADPDSDLRDNLIKLKGRVEEIQGQYRELVPDPSTTKQLQDRFMQIAESVGISMDDVKRHLIGNTETVAAYKKRLKEQVESTKAQVQILTQTIKVFAASVDLLSESEKVAYEAVKKELEKQEKSLKLQEQEYETVSKYLPDEDKSKKSDSRLSEAQSALSELEKMYKKYQEFAKSMSKDSAYNKVNDMFAETIRLIKETSKGNIDIKLPRTAEEYKREIAKIRDYIKTLPKSQKAVIEAQFKINDVDFDEAQKQIEEQLKKLQSEIAQSKAAKDFFDNIFSQTKDYDMAMELTMSVYGDTGENYQQQIIDQIRAAFGAGTDWEIDVTPAINVGTGAVDYNELEKLMETALKDENLEKYRAQMQKVIDDGRKFGAERAKQWAKDLAVQQAYAQKRVELARYTAERIREIETDPNLTAEAKATYTQLYVDREAKEAAKLEYEAFKDTPLYVAMFEDLENASTVSLEAMKRKLIELRSEWKNLDPKQLKEMQKRFAEIEDELAERSINPFAQLKKGQADIRKWQQDLKTLTAGMGLGADGQGISTMKELDAARVQKANELSAAQDTLNTQLAEEVQYKRELTDLQMQYDELLKGAVAPEDAEARAIGQAMQAKKEQIQVTSENVAKSTEQVDNLQQQNNQLDEQADYYKRIRERMKKAWNGADKIKDAVLDVADSAYEMAEAFGASEDALALFSEIKNAVMAIYDATKTVSQALITISETAVASVKAVESASIILAVISAALQVATAIANLIFGSKARAKERAIKKEQELIDQLTYSYEKLADATDSLFGSAYISNYNQRIKNLQAQQASYMKQAQLEREKGKKADKDKIKDYEESARDAADEIIKMQNEIAETLAGTDVASAARDFASAWLDAYISFETTSDKIKEKFNEMIKNMIIESAMGQIVQAVLQPFYDKITAAAQSDDRLTAEEVVELAKQIPTYTNQITDGLQIFASQLESLGMDLSELGESSEFTGIAREIASASEESITGLAAMINTQNYYISNVPLILQEVQLIRQYLTGGTAYAPAAEQASTTDLLTLQNEYLAHLPAIHTNTEAIAERCERAAMACENIADSLGRVIKPRGFSSEYVVNIN